MSDIRTDLLVVCAQMEAAVARLRAETERLHKEADQAQVMIATLGRLLGRARNSLQTPNDASEIINSIAKEDGIFPTMLNVRWTREKRIVRCRRRVIVALMDHGFSTTVIGKLLGGLDHSTVIYQARKHHALSK